MADDANKQSNKRTSSPLRPLTQETCPLTPSAPVSIPLRARMFQHLYRDDFQKPLSSPESSGDHQMAATPRDLSPPSSKVGCKRWRSRLCVFLCTLSEVTAAAPEADYIHWLMVMICVLRFVNNKHQIVLNNPILLQSYSVVHYSGSCPFHALIPL